jgi:hypothetical protein
MLLLFALQFLRAFRPKKTGSSRREAQRTQALPAYF